MADEDRVCPFYLYTIETESDVIMGCPQNEDIRYDFIQWAGGQDILDLNANMSSIEMFNSLFRSSNVVLVRKIAKICSDILRRRRGLLHK